MVELKWTENSFFLIQLKVDLIQIIFYEIRKIQHLINDICHQISGCIKKSNTWVHSNERGCVGHWTMPKFWAHVSRLLCTYTGHEHQLQVMFPWSYHNICSIKKKYHPMFNITGLYNVAWKIHSTVFNLNNIDYIIEDGSYIHITPSSLVLSYCGGGDITLLLNIWCMINMISERLEPFFVIYISFDILILIIWIV